MLFYWFKHHVVSFLAMFALLDHLLTFKITWQCRREENNIIYCNGQKKSKMCWMGHNYWSMSRKWPWNVILQTAEQAEVVSYFYFFTKCLKKQGKIFLIMTGLEPAILRFGIWCLIHLATWALQGSSVRRV